MKSKNAVLVLMAVVLTAVIANGCGGGGGGSGETVNYEGVTQPAVLDTTSSSDLGKESVLLVVDDPVGDAPLPASLENPSFVQLTGDPSTAVDMAVNYLRGGSPARSLGVAATQLSVECDSVLFDTGSGGGELWFQICIDLDDAMSGTDTDYFVKLGFDFRGYTDYDMTLDENVYIDGKVLVQGIFDEEANGGEGDFVDDVRVIIRDLITQTTESDNVDTYVDGWVDYDESAGVYSITYNLFTMDSIAGEGVWLDNYTVVMNDNNDTMTVDGRLYDVHDGYVEVETVTPISWTMHYDSELGQVVFDDNYPSAGVVLLTGAGGAWIQIEFRDEGTPEYRVTVDLDNDPEDDPLWEWQSSWLPWEEVS